MRIEEIVEVNRPPEEVFSYVTNPENLPEWSNLVLEVCRETEGDLREGDRFTTAAKFLGRRFETPSSSSPTHTRPRGFSGKAALVVPRLMRC